MCEFTVDEGLSGERGAELYLSRLWYRQQNSIFIHCMGVLYAGGVFCGEDIKLLIMTHCCSEV